ncbi:hypothetical protein Agub_g3641 [Astrephomene gubernaculifera]|uniref:Uncharacterized protein n=1 Tax=Astrephomene gubernaculifera TaxID=47775 RepID=A0AAD3DLM8_9CHLO|nr:hypothetical protein Agub_g3641 [Astrephomene gubernaculifera]
MSRCCEEAGPRSWAEDICTYRAARGCQSFSTLRETTVPERYSRTNYVPFCDTRHALFPYNDFVDGKGTVRVDPTITADRYARHGWGDTSLLKEEGYSGSLHARSSTHKRGRRRPTSPHSADGRNGLFGVLQMTEAGCSDGWIGHPLVDPGKGKRPVAAPSDPKGRRDLFDVLHVRAPGMPADDAWLGNKLIDPAKGRAHPPGPEQQRGRQNLTDVMAMSIMHDPRRLELLAKGADPLGDAWCGNKLIDPARGKRILHSSPATMERLHGSTFRPDAVDALTGLPYSDAPRRHAQQVPPPVPDTADAVIRGQGGGGGDERGRLGKKPFPDLPAPNKFDGRRDLYAHMRFKPLTEVEQVKYSRAFDDRGTRGRKTVPMPGGDDPSKGPDLLHWRPEVRVGQFVPHGGLAQEGRVKGSTLRATGSR